MDGQTIPATCRVAVPWRGAPKPAASAAAEPHGEPRT